MSETDEERKSDRISKSAAILAGAAVLILGQAFQAPFTMADKKSLTANNVSPEPEAEHASRVQVLTAIAQMDSASLAASGFAIILCTIAGFPTSWLRLRFVFLIFGGFFVFVAFGAIVLVFATGLSLVYPGKWATDYINIMFMSLVVIQILAAVMLPLLCSRVITLHSRTRCARLGFGAGCCSLFRCRPGASWIPLMSVVLPLLAVVLTLIPVLVLVLLPMDTVETAAIFARKS